MLLTGIWMQLSAEALGYSESDMGDLPAEQILELAKRFGVTNVRVFGSRARGDATSDSDLDLLVEYTDGTSLLDVIGFEQELEELLGVKVETVSERALHPIIRDRILAEAVPLVAA
jgi:predicted nucleotidyltransferase